MPFYPKGRTCRKCGEKFMPERYAVGQECPACKEAITAPRPCKNCGAMFVRHSPCQVNCKKCLNAKKRKCRVCRIQLDAHNESSKYGYCHNCKPADRFCCICGQQIQVGFRCKACKEFVTREHSQGYKRSDFNPSSPQGFYLTHEEMLYQRQLKLERLRKLWQARGW